MFKQKGLFKTSVLIMLFSIAIASLFTLFTNEAIAAEDNSATVEINLLETSEKPEGLIEKDTIKVSPHSDSVKASFYYEKVEEDSSTKPDSSKTDSNTKPSSQTNSKNKATTADTSDTKAHALVIASISIVGILSILKGKDLKKVAGVLAIVVGLTTVFSAPYAYATNTDYKIGDTIKIEGKTGEKTTFKAPALTGYKVIGYTIDSNPYIVSYVDAFDEDNPQTIATYKVEENKSTPKLDKELPVHEGYKLDGWEPEIENTVTKNITYTAKWAKFHTVTINLATQKAFNLEDSYNFVDDNKAKANNTKTKDQWREAKQKEYASYIDLNSLNLKVDEVEQKLTKDDLNDKGQIILTVKDGSKISLGTPEISRYFTFENWDIDLNNPIINDTEINGSWDDAWYFYMDEDSKEGVITLDKPSESVNYSKNPMSIPKDLISLKCDKPIILRFAGALFKDCNNLTDLSAFKNWDTTNITFIHEMFRGCKKINNLTALQNWDVSNAEVMFGMFAKCQNLKDLEGIKNWDTSNAAYMYSMFEDCSAIQSLAPLQNWNVSNNHAANRMFYGCSNLTDLTGLDNWDMANANSTGSMFAGCNNLTDLSALKDWNTSQVINMSKMFYNCDSITNLSALKNWNTSQVTNMNYMFYECRTLNDLSALKDWNTSNVTNMERMFAFCTGVNDLSPINNWDVSKVTNMNGIFEQCDAENKPSWYKK